MPQPTTVSSYTDDQLLVAAQAENTDARNALYGRFHGLLRAMIAKRCPHRAARQPDFVDDVVNQTFAFVLDPTITRFDPRRGRASQYLFGLTCNAIRMITRQRMPACVDLGDHGRAEVFQSGRIASTVYRHVCGPRSMPAPGQDLEARDEVRLALEGGDRETSRVVKEHFFDGEPFVGIAARLGVAHTTVSRRVTGFLASARLRLA